MQIDWIYKESYKESNQLQIKNQDISISKGGKPDFLISFNTETREINLLPYHDGIISVMEKTSMADFMFRAGESDKNNLFIYED